MPVDNSIYGMIKPIDVIGSIDKGMRMRDMIDERKKKSAVQDAYKQGMKTGLDGKVSFDHNMTASALAQGGYGEEAYQAQQQGQGDQQKQMELTVKRAQFGAQVLGAARNQDEWNQGLQQLQNNGMDASKLPSQFSPENQKFLVDAAMSLGDRLNEQWKQKEYNLQERALTGKQNADRAETSGQKKLDQEWATDYNTWTSGGADTAATEINKLQNVVSKLTAGEVTNGGMTGALGDRLTSNKVLGARADVQSTVMNSLKAILGAQFTEKEGERIIKNTWNEADSTENNATRLERLIGDLESQALAKSQKAEYFKNNNATLAGFSPNGSRNKANQQASQN